jgi:hypothetical protein
MLPALQILVAQTVAHWRHTSAPPCTYRQGSGRRGYWKSYRQPRPRTKVIRVRYAETHNKRIEEQLAAIIRGVRLFQSLVGCTAASTIHHIQSIVANADFNASNLTVRLNETPFSNVFRCTMRMKTIPAAKMDVHRDAMKS